MEICRKKLRKEVLKRIQYVKTCVMARELCLLVRSNRAVLEPKDVEEVCKYISNLCKEEGCFEPSDLCMKAASAITSNDEKKYFSCRFVPVGKNDDVEYAACMTDHPLDNKRRLFIRMKKGSPEFRYL